MWNCVKEYLRVRGVECNSPRNCFRELIKEGIVPEDYEGALSKLIVLRNELVHLYDEERAKEIFEELKKPEVLETFSAVLNGIKGD